MKDPDIRIEDLPEDMQIMAELIGMTAVLRLSAHYGGEQIHIHRLDTLVRAARDRDVVADWRAGKDYQTLSRKYHLSTRRIRQILADATATRRAGNTSRQQQLSLF
ncbi:hypothetical protein DSCO28_50580 [Desulfosarcina ovata subsp. sediminis]|uniref:Mor transcription activator domain-containing protein n=1 Tax=Desulfosarcina ovata subsp. sediminis TaxID=885957 RepID=A0A5K7ZGS9_9BACT|nr:Mor transcription activator family protein [Desulfosarcina ovata]BBO80186.1 hypothetical protein DSCO28_07520 [Desulfosarcina ovata subsp. sediminis]BBO84492.1 hypothetical protein DSCO28_50580 [Desulfosarcina ovata subsp. sediminis]